jgi:hypothetical protein
VSTGNSTAASSAPSDRSAFDIPAILWLLVGLGLWMLYPVSGFRDVVGGLVLPDTDDAMRLVQVRDFLAGQGWFDMVQHRLMPPGGASMHWSRLVDAPLAGLIGLATPWLGQPLAEGLVAALWPPALFGLCLALVYRAVRTRYGFRAALLALFTATQTANFGGLFAFGRIDHHNVQALLVLALALCLADPVPALRRAALGGMAAATSLAVGLEALPFIAIAGVFLVGDWVLRGRTALPALVGFALALAGTSLALFAVQTAPALWGVTRCDALSPPWLWLAVAAAATAPVAGWLGGFLATPGRRAGFAAACGAVTVAGFVLLAPRCLSGPFQDLPAVVRSEWLERVLEMQPFHRLVLTMPGAALAYGVPPLLAGLVAVHAALRGRPPLRRAAALAAAFLLAGFVLAQFQLRGLYMAGIFVALVAGPLLDHAITILGRPVRASRKVAILALALALMPRSWTALLLPLDPGGAFPVGASGAATQTGPATTQACDAGGVLSILDALAPGTILAPVDLGPAILLRTRHGVVAAPYHRAIAGLTASEEGLHGDEAALKRALAASGADYLALCAGTGPESPEERPFARQLVSGAAPPEWLERLSDPGAPLAVWRFRRDG